MARLIGLEATQMTASELSQSCENLLEDIEVAADQISAMRRRLREIQRERDRRTAIAVFRTFDAEQQDRIAELLSHMGVGVAAIDALELANAMPARPEARNVFHD